MRLGEEPRSPVERELAALGDRLRAAQGDVVAAMTAISAIVILLAILGGWPAV